MPEHPDTPDDALSRVYRVGSHNPRNIYVDSGNRPTDKHVAALNATVPQSKPESPGGKRQRTDQSNNPNGEGVNR